MKRSMKIKKLLMLSCIIPIFNTIMLQAMPVNVQPGENIWHVAAGIGTCIDQIGTQACDLTGTFTTLDATLHKACTIESKINQICSVGDFQATWTALAEFGACNAIPITSITTITAAGSYCLANSILDLTNTNTIITIASSDVVLDLNGQTLSGLNGVLVDSSASYSGITIKNGFIDGGTTGINAPGGSSVTNMEISNVSIINTGSIGMILNGIITNLLIKDCLMQNSVTRNVDLENSQEIIIENCLFDGASGDGISIIFCNDILIKCCECNNNSILGLGLSVCNNTNISNSIFNDNFVNMGIDGCTDLQIKQCMACSGGQSGIEITNNSAQTVGIAITDSIFNQNALNGIWFNTSNDTSVFPFQCLEFNNCEANANNQNGVSVESIISPGDGTAEPRNIYFNDCFASGNTMNGFQVSRGLNICFTNCTSNENTQHGFNLSNGLMGASGADQNSGLIKECIAIGNTGCGFNDDFSGTAPVTKFSYVANLAKGNGETPAGSPDTNYCINATATAFVSPGPATTGSFLQIGQTKFPKSYWDNITLS